MNLFPTRLSDVTSSSVPLNSVPLESKKIFFAFSAKTREHINFKKIAVDLSHNNPVLLIDPRQDVVFALVSDKVRIKMRNNGDFPRYIEEIYVGDDEFYTQKLGHVFEVQRNKLSLFKNYLNFILKAPWKNSYKDKVIVYSLGVYPGE